eukprot:9491382-Pyramimonas_sp.AAC.1
MLVAGWHRTTDDHELSFECSSSGQGRPRAVQRVGVRVRPPGDGCGRIEVVGSSGLGPDREDDEEDEEGERMERMKG